MNSEFLQLKHYLKYRSHIHQLAISLEIRPLAALYPPRIFLDYTIERGANAVGMSILDPATTENGDRERSLRSQPYRAHFLYGGGGGYNAANGLISRKITL